MFVMAGGRRWEGAEPPRKMVIAMQKLLRRNVRQMPPFRQTDMDCPSDHLSGKGEISRGSNGFRWKVQFSGEFGLMAAREKLVNRSDGGEAIRHGSVILMPFSRSTRPARCFFLPASASCFLPSFSSPRLTDFPTLLRSLARSDDDDEEDGHSSASRKQDHVAVPSARQRGGSRGEREGMAKAAVITSPACAISEMAGDMGPYA